MKKKVIQLIHGLTMGGAETLVKEYCLKLDKEKYDVSVLCFYKYNSPYEKLLEEKGIRITYIDDYTTRKKNGRIKNVISIFKRYCFIKKYFENEKPDVIHTHLTLNTYVLLAKPKQEIKIIHSVHSEPSKLWNKKLSRRIDFFAARKLAYKYDMRFITLHENMRKEVNEMFGVKDSIVLNNGIDFKRFEDALNKKKVRYKENIPQDAYVIGHVGRFSPQKNHRLLVEAFEKIIQKKENAFLLFVGNGAIKNDIQQLLIDKGLNKRSLILSDRTDIPDLLNAMDIFTLPSCHEGLGISLIEAQKMGLPCVVSDTIPEGAIISNLVMKVSLHEPIDFWAEKLMNHKVTEIRYHGLKEWDMAYVINKLQEIYG